jgi:hypothetical protein
LSDNKNVLAGNSSFSSLVYTILLEENLSNVSLLLMVDISQGVYGIWQPLIRRGLPEHILFEARGAAVNISLSSLKGTL